MFPEQIKNYHEPFLGSGAVFFRLRGRIEGKSFLSDRIGDLIGTYEAVRDDVEGVIKRLRRHVYDRDYYYRIRAQNLRRLSAAARAARFIYLNRSGFNGLYRVNKKGEYNVPFGRYKNPTICDAPTLRAASAALRGVRLSVRGFKALVKSTRAGDFVYLDPPYHPLSPTASFTSYTAEPFGEAEQCELAGVCRTLDGRGVRFMLSNSYTPLIRRLYKGFRTKKIYVPRPISSKATARGPVPEVVVRNYA